MLRGSLGTRRAVSSRRSHCASNHRYSASPLSSSTCRRRVSTCSTRSAFAGGIRHVGGRGSAWSATGAVGRTVPSSSRRRSCTVSYRLCTVSFRLRTSPDSMWISSAGFRGEEDPLDGRLAVPPRYVHGNAASRACPRSADPAFWSTRPTRQWSATGIAATPAPTSVRKREADAAMASGAQVRRTPAHSHAKPGRTRSGAWRAPC